MNVPHVLLIKAAHAQIRSFPKSCTFYSEGIADKTYHQHWETPALLCLIPRHKTQPPARSIKGLFPPLVNREIVTIISHINALNLSKAERTIDYLPINRNLHYGLVLRYTFIALSQITTQRRKYDIKLYQILLL